MRVMLALHEEEAVGVPLLFLRRIVRAVLVREGRLCSARSVTLSIAAVSEPSIRMLNERYRGIGRPTDILSFSEERAILEQGGARHSCTLGDLVIAPAVIARAARTQGFTYRYELVSVVAHGVLHLLGYDHEPRHFHLQDAVTDSLIHIRPKKV